MKCPSNEELIRYLERLGQEELDNIEQHVEECVRCPERIEILIGERPARGPLLREGLPHVAGYDVTAEIGRGGMGTVYRAQDRLNRLVALKLMGGPLSSIDDLRRFRKEAEYAAALSHKNIVQVFEYGESEGVPYISMELIEGRSLADAIRLGNAACDCKDAARLLAKISDAVQFAHERGVLHRDIKPGNILLDGAGEPHVADFGLARRLNADPSLESAGAAVVGTANYMPPEQAKGTPVLTTAADVYSLGAVLYAVLTGRPPFQGDQPLDILWQVVHQEPANPRSVKPTVAPDLEVICLKCLQKDPDKRYPSARALAKDLMRFAAGEPIQARLVRSWERGLSWARRRPVLAAYFAAVVGLLVAFITLWLFDDIMVRAANADLKTARDKADQNADQARKEETNARTAKLHAETETARAEAEKLRAEKNEAKAKEHARETLRQAAGFELARGQRLAALTLYDRLLPALPADDQLACRVERLPCLFAYSQWDRLLPELAELANLPLPPTLHAQVLLHQGDVAFWRVDLFPTADGRKHLTAALSIANGLRDADAEYARGLLADGCLEAIQHYEKALAHAPFHPRARVNLLFELIFSGQFEAAERQLDLAAASFPQEPLVPAAGVCLTTLQQRLKDREPFMESLRQQLPKEHFQKMKKLFLAMDRGIKAFAPEQALGAAEANFINPLRPAWGPDLGPLVGVAIPVVRRPVELFDALGRVYLRFTFGDSQGACTQCAVWSQKSPEAWFRLAHAMARAQLAQRHEKAGKWAEMFDESARAYELVAEARRSPTIIPTSGIHRQAAWICLGLHAGWLETRQRTSRSAACALLQPPGLPGNSVLPSLVQIKAGMTLLEPIPNHYDRSWVFAAATESHGFDAARSAFLPGILFFLPADDGRLLLSDWAADEPKSITPLQLRAKFEVAQRNWHEARRYARTVLERQPQNREMLTLLEKLPKQEKTEP